MERKFFMGRDRHEVTVFHTHPIARLGNVFPKAGTAPRIQNGFELSEAGEFCRVHTNGDAFLFNDTEWLRVDLDTVDFVSRSK
jgi:hypothetical protein